MGLRWGRRCRELLGWSLQDHPGSLQAPRVRVERRRTLAPHQNIVNQQIKTLTQLSRDITQSRRTFTQSKTTQGQKAFLSTSQSEMRMPEQSTFGSCLNRTVDDRLFGLTEEERELRRLLIRIQPPPAFPHHF